MLAPGRKVFPKHPLAYDGDEAQRRAAKAMLVNHGRIVGRVWIIEQDCICYVNTRGMARTSWIERDQEDTGWVLGREDPGWIFSSSALTGEAA